MVTPVSLNTPGPGLVLLLLMREVFPSPAAVTVAPAQAVILLMPVILPSLALAPAVLLSILAALVMAPKIIVFIPNTPVEVVAFKFLPPIKAALSIIAYPVILV